MGINAVEFNKMAREVFAPLYPVVAKQIKDKAGMIEGICLDIGTGPGYLGINMAKITKLQVYLLDILQEMLDIAEHNIIENGLENRVETLLADVHQMPFKSKSVDLVISRGSIFFWEDKPKAIKEIYRILAPGGIAYIGGGFGTREIKEQIDIKMKKINKEWKRDVKQRIGEMNKKKFEDILQLLGVQDYEMINNESGWWMIIKRRQDECDV